MRGESEGAKDGLQGPEYFLYRISSLPRMENPSERRLCFRARGALFQSGGVELDVAVDRFSSDRLQAGATYAVETEACGRSTWTYYYVDAFEVLPEPGAYRVKLYGKQA